MDWDKQLTDWGVQPVEKPDSKWRLLSGHVLDPVAMGQASVIRIAVVHGSGAPWAGVVCYSDWKGRDPKDAPPGPLVTESYPGAKFGKCEFQLTGVIHPGQKDGPHFAYVEEDRAKSDEVTGMGRFDGKPTSIELTFAMRNEPKDFESAIKVAAAGKPSLFAGHSMLNFAQERHFGYARTDEFDFVFGGVTYVVQDYRDHILYIVKGDATHVYVVKK